MSGASQKKWRKEHPEANRELKKLNYVRGRQHTRNHREKWTIEHERMVLEHDVTDRELARILGRSVQAIQMKRTKLKAKVTSDA